MKQTNVCYQTATELVSALANKKISSVELLDETISRIEALDTKINAIPIRHFEQARLAAKAADEAIAKNKNLSLLGLPMTVKESFDVKGFKTSWANPFFKNHQPQDDALTVQRLKAAGAVIIGKSNVPWMLADWQTYNELYGTTNNPWDLSVTPGGSSGGSAAALAAGFVALELGSDLAGSLRVPAHFCGIYAHKPSQDLVPIRGAQPPSVPVTPNRIDMAVAGPMARCAADLALGMNIIAGPDELWDGKGYQLALPLPRHQNLKNYRVLVIDQHPACPTAQVIQDAVNNFAEELIKVGAQVACNLGCVPDLKLIAEINTTLLGGFFAGDMPISEYEKAKMKAEQLPQNEKSLAAYFSRGLVNSHRDWMIAMRTRMQLREQWRQLYKNYDVIITPVMPTVAFKHDHSDPDKRQIKVDGKSIDYGDQFIWVGIANLFGLPATSAPIALSETGLPIGIQIIGDYLEDLTTIKFAELIEQAFGGFRAPAIHQ